jgi:predicted protein tyrosine phosphatase
MRILALCERGLNRSTTAQYLLQDEPDTEILSAGLRVLSPQTLRMLFDWADRIILLDARFTQGIPPEKLVVWDVGPDRYEHHFNPELVRLLRSYAQNWKS